MRAITPPLALSFRHALLAASLLAGVVPFPTLAQAEKTVKEPSQMPQLTVNFTLSSDADAATTSYYSQIVEELLKSLPRRVNIPGELGGAAGQEPVYEHLKVVSYLPKQTAVDADDMAMEIRYFNVAFEAPKGILNLVETDALPPGVEGKAIVVREEKYDDFVSVLYKKGAASQPSGQAQASAANTLPLTAAPTVPEGMAYVVVGEGEKARTFVYDPKEYPTPLMAEMAALQMQEAESAAQSPLVVPKAAKAPVKPMPVKPVSHAQAPKEVPPLAPAKPTHAKPTVQTPAVAAPHMPTASRTASLPNTFAKGGLYVRYYGDNLSPMGVDANHVARWAKTTAAEGAKRYLIVSQVTPVPMGSAAQVREARVDEIRHLLKENGMVLGAQNLSEIRLYPLSGQQFIMLESRP